MAYVLGFGEWVTKRKTTTSYKYYLPPMRIAGGLPCVRHCYHSKGASVQKAKWLNIVAGNSRPRGVPIAISEGNSSFFTPWVAVNYNVSVTDP